MSSKTLIGSWSRLTARVRLYRSSHALSVAGKKVYIFGGEVVPREPVDNKVDVVELDAGLGHAVQTLPTPSEAPAPRVGSPSTALNGDVYIFSGRGGIEMKPIEENGGLWRYQASEAKWELIQPTNQAAPFPAGRSYHCISTNGVNGIYVHSGCPETGRLSDLWLFDIAQKTWTELPAAPGPARGGASIAFANGKLYRINGFDGKTEQGGSLEVFDVPAASWSTISYKADGVDGPEPRSVSTLVPVTVHGRVYLVTMFGERDPSALGHAGAGKMLDDIWAFGIEEARWQKIQGSAGDDLPVARGWFDADVTKDEVGNDAIIVHGGLDEENKRLGDVWKLSFSN